MSLERCHEGECQVRTIVDSEVKSDLVKPSPAYRRNVWVAMGALLLFVVAYLSLTAAFAWTSYRLFHDSAADSKNEVLRIFGGVVSVFFALFLVKGLFFVKRGREGNLIEVQVGDEPALFDMLRELASDTGAPFPHRVFLSPEVNAAVFYDLSPINLIIPSRKNLVIGLGLVNSLSMSELKAVVAHEFGHFAQRSMAVGRWVYTSQQVAAAIIAKRDVFDNLLQWLSRTDIRIAWLGWVMRIIVWSLRAVLESFFSVVVLAERALSRQMELNADLVAVSVMGSDALVNALHKLEAADRAWDDAVDFFVSELHDERRIPDVYEVQTHFVEMMRGVLADKTMGERRKSRRGVAPRIVFSRRSSGSRHACGRPIRRTATARTTPSSATWRSISTIAVHGSCSTTLHLCAPR